MSVWSDLFGSTEAPKVSSVSNLTNPQNLLLNKLIGLIGGNLGDSSINTYPGNWTTPASSVQQSLFSSIENLLKKNGTTKPNAVAQANAQTLSQGFTAPTVDAGTYNPTAVKQWYTDALVKPAMQTWEKEIVPQVQEKFIGQNAGSSGAANRAIANSAEDVMSNLNSQLANAMYGEKQAFDTRAFTADTTNAANKLNTNQLNLNALTSGGNLSMGADTNAYNQLASLLGIANTAGAQQYGVNQNATQGGYQQWLAQQPYSNPWLTYLGTALGTSATTPVVTGAVQQQGALSSLSPIIAALLG